MIFTDHKNLEYLKTAKCLNSCHFQWALLFAQFYFMLSYRLSSKNIKAASLSHLYPTDNKDPSPECMLSSPVLWELWLGTLTTKQQTYQYKSPPHAHRIKCLCRPAWGASLSLRHKQLHPQGSLAHREHITCYSQSTSGPWTDFTLILLFSYRLTSSYSQLKAQAAFSPSTVMADQQIDESLAEWFAHISIYVIRHQLCTLI